MSTLLIMSVNLLRTESVVWSTRESPDTLGTRDTTTNTVKFAWQSARGAFYGGARKVEYWLAPALRDQMQLAKTSCYTQPSNRFLKLGLAENYCIAAQDAVSWSDHRLEMLTPPSPAYWEALVQAGYQPEWVGNRKESYGAQGGATYSDYKVSLLLCWRTSGSIGRGEPGTVLHPTEHSVMSRDLIEGQGGPNFYKTPQGFCNIDSLTLAGLLKA